jgi:hypothetical protein
VVVEGEAIRVIDDAALERLAEAWANRWDGSYWFVVREGYFVMSRTKAFLRSSCSP